MWKEVIQCIIGIFCILKMVDSHSANQSAKSDASNKIWSDEYSTYILFTIYPKNLSYSIYPKSHGESKMCFTPAQMADKSYLPSVAIRMNGITPFFNQTEQPSEISTQKESFLFVINPYPQQTCEKFGLFKRILDFLFVLFLPFLDATHSFTFLSLILLNIYVVLALWTSLRKMSNPVDFHKKNYFRVFFCITVTFEVTLWCSFFIFSGIIFDVKPYAEIYLFYEDKIYFDLDQESKLCFTPEELADNLSTVLARTKINGTRTFNQADTSILGSSYGNQPIVIPWNSYDMVYIDSWKELISDTVLFEENILLKIVVSMFTAIFIRIILTIFFISVNCFMIYMIRWAFKVIDDIESEGEGEDEDEDGEDEGDGEGKDKDEDEGEGIVMPVPISEPNLKSKRKKR